MNTKSQDLIAMEKDELGAKLLEALKADDEQSAAKAMTEFACIIQQNVLDSAMSLTAEQAADKNILAARGVRVLTNVEQKYYTELIGAMSSSPRQALENIEIAMPETIIDSVFEDIIQQHPLLDALDFRNTNGAIKMIVNKGGIQLAVWGKLTDAYTKELSGSIDEIDTTLCKLTAFIPVAKAMLDLGPAWLDRYVRAILSEALAFGAENAYINGTGKNEPIGINRIVGSKAVVTDGVYAKKEAIKVTSFDPVTYGDLCSRLATNSENGLSRAVTGLILIVNPVDFLKTIMPATTVLSPSGVYVKDVLPIPTRIIQSQMCEQGTAYLGMGKKYFAPLGSSKNGKIEYDDSVQFMEDNRVYAIRMYGNGMPLDNNAFITLDISELRALRYPVSTFAESMDNGTAGGDTSGDEPTDGGDTE